MQTKYNQIRKLPPEKFRRLTGVKKGTFYIMLEVLDKAEREQRGKGGPKPKLCLEDRLLLALEYLREYRTYLHIGASYGLSESQTQRTHHWVESELMKDKRFHLPGRKKLLGSDHEIEVVLIDATETPIERPKKNGP